MLCSSRWNLFYRLTSIATSGTAGCKRPASILIATCRRTPALASLRDAAIYPHINRCGLCGYDLSAGRADVLFRRDPFRRERHNDEAGFPRLRGRHGVMIWMLLRQTVARSRGLVAYLWHPLPMWEVANSGHIDALMVALMMTGLWLVISRKTLRGVAAISLALLAKPFALLALPACWRPWDWRAPRFSCRNRSGLLRSLFVSRCRVFGFLAGYLREERYSKTVVTIGCVNRVAVGVRRSHADSTVYLVLAGLDLAVLALPQRSASDRTPHTILADTGQAAIDFPASAVTAVSLVFFGNHAICGARRARYLWAASIGALLLQEEVDWGEIHSALHARKTGLYGGIAVAWLWSMWRTPAAIVRIHGAKTVTGH